MKPIVAMNSSTGIPLSTWTFLKTSSAIGGLAPAGWPAGGVWPLAGKALSGPFSRQRTAAPSNPTIVCLDPSFMASIPLGVPWLRQRLRRQWALPVIGTVGVVAADARRVHLVAEG